jgi:O-antigen ligase
LSFAAAAAPPNMQNTTTVAVPQRGNVESARYARVRIPSRNLEVGFYAAMVYSLTADVWGITIPMFAGALTLAIAALCIWELRTFAKSAYAPIWLLLACAISYILVQVVMHEESIRSESIRPFIVWIMQLLVVHSLCLRPGFSRRYPLVLFCIAALSLPYLAYNTGPVERAHVQRDLGLGGGLASVNGLGEWFGFFAIYFAICGLETNRFIYRVAAWGTMLGCLLVVGLTVSRGSMFGAALAIVIAFRSLLKRGFIPVLLLITVTGIVYESGLFHRAITSYEERALQESGRERIWPAVIDRIADTPIVGVGESEVATQLSAARFDQPHNTFLYIALSAGVLPAGLLLAFFVQAGRKSARQTKIQKDESFRVPYLVFTFVVLMLGDLGFMAPWALLTVTVAAGSQIVYGRQRLVAVRTGNKVRFGIYAGHDASGAETMIRSKSTYDVTRTN